jgi:PAS domain S-box-containing protein
MVKIEKKSLKTSHQREENLVLRLNKFNSIIKYNNECKKTFGFTQEKIINGSFFDNLVPKRYLNHWEKILNSAVQKPHINEFKLPLITKNGHEIMISWVIFPIKNKNGEVCDIDIVGSLISSWDDFDDSEPIKSDNYNIQNPPIWKEVRINKLDNKKDNKSLSKDTQISDILQKYNFLKEENAYLKKYIKKIKNKSSENYNSKKNIFGKTVYKLSDIIGGKKRIEEFKSIKKELDAREEYLKDLHSLIKEDKKNIINQRKDLVKWREKLELLESDIESRKKWVENKEKTLKKYYPSNDNKPLNSDENFEDLEPSDLIYKISDCAAIVQRGIFKDVNSSFADLLGYTSNELIDKSLFDFIVSNSFSSMENYYLNKLKGGKTSNINTKFLTSDNDRINVEISTKPVFFNGEKAELFIIKSKKDDSRENFEKFKNISSDKKDKPKKEMSKIFSRLKEKRQDFIEEKEKKPS